MYDRLYYSRLNNGFVPGGGRDGGGPTGTKISPGGGTDDGGEVKCTNGLLRLSKSCNVVARDSRKVDLVILILPGGWRPNLLEPGRGGEEGSSSGDG